MSTRSSNAKEVPGRPALGPSFAASRPCSEDLAAPSGTLLGLRVASDRITKPGRSTRLEGYRDRLRPGQVPARPREEVDVLGAQVTWTGLRKERRYSFEARGALGRAFF